MPPSPMDAGDRGAGVPDRRDPSSGRLSRPDLVLVPGVGYLPRNHFWCSFLLEELEDCRQMKRIFGSLLVIVAIVGAGVLATGAYFTTTDTANNYTFTTGSASLVFGPCAGVNADCSAVVPTLTTYSFVTSTQTGPGLTSEGCMVVENTGAYLLHLTANEVVASASPDGMQDAFQVYSALTNSEPAPDPATGAVIYSVQSARSAAAAGNVAVTDLAPLAKIYILTKNSWDSTGNQNGLQNGNITSTPR